MKLSPGHKALYKVIDEILWNDWDPIGMKYMKGPRDEYERYVPIIFSLKITGADVETIASKLYKIETETIGFDHGYENSKAGGRKNFRFKILKAAYSDGFKPIAIFVYERNRSVLPAIGRTL